MGLNLKDLVVREKTTLESFASRIIAIDAYNALYQFLATIRGYDGAQLAEALPRTVCVMYAAVASPSEGAST